MDRLTEKRQGQWVIPLRQDGKHLWSLCSAGMGDVSAEYLYGEYADRLAAYEDIGPVDHLRELVQAKKDGRLVVLPWAVGQTIYEADQEHGVVRHTIRDVDWYMNSYAVDDAGNSWYDYWTADDERLAHLTREEAEAALKGETNETDPI